MGAGFFLTRHQHRYRGTALVLEPMEAKEVCDDRHLRRKLEAAMHGIIYLVGLIVVILAILSFFGLH